MAKTLTPSALKAKQFRADVKAGVKAGTLPKGLKLSVQTSNYSMGSSITVSILKAPGVNIANPRRVMAERAEPHGYHNETILTPEAQQLEDQLEAMIDAPYKGSPYVFVSYCSDLYRESAAAVTKESADQFRAEQQAKDAQERAAWEAKEEIERAKRAAIISTMPRPEPKPVPEFPETGFAIRFNWSESSYVDGGLLFDSFEAANAHIGQAEILERAEAEQLGREWGGYYKTQFSVSLDGDTYTGRFDIGADLPTIEAHILAFCDPVQNPFLRNATPEDQAENIEWAVKIQAALDAQQGGGFFVVKAPVYSFDSIPGGGLN